MKLLEYNLLLDKWFKVRNMQSLDPKNQLLKTVEELGELIEAKNFLDVDLAMDAIGDIYVCLTGLQLQLKYDYFNDETMAYNNELDKVILQVCNISQSLLKGKNCEPSIQLAFLYLEGYCNYLGLRLIDCIAIAWNEIKDRKGLVIEGSFVKYDDLSEQDQAVIDLQEEMNK